MTSKYARIGLAFVVLGGGGFGGNSAESASPTFSVSRGSAPAAQASSPPPSTTRSNPSYATPPTAPPTRTVTERVSSDTSRPVGGGALASSTQSSATTGISVSRGATDASGVSVSSRPISQTSDADAAVSRSLSRESLSRFEAERARVAPAARAPIAAPSEVRDNPTVREASQSYGTMDNYLRARSTARAAAPPAPPVPAEMQSRYGVWDTVFLMSLMNNMSNNSQHGAWAAAHRDDPAFQDFRRDLDRAGRENAELRQKIDDMERSMTAAPPTRPTNGSLPEGVSAAEALAPEAMVASPHFTQFSDKESHWGWWIFVILIMVGLVGFMWVRRNMLSETSRVMQAAGDHSPRRASVY